MDENNKVDLRRILSVSGFSSLFMFISKAKNGVIVEDINDKHKTLFGETARVSSLNDIAVYTDKEEVPLKQLLENIKAKENANAISMDVKKVSTDEIKKYFEEVLPNYDHDRLYVSHMKKIADWYNQLQRNNMLDFEDEQAENSDKA